MTLNVSRRGSSARIEPAVLVAVLLSGAAVFLLQGVFAPLALALFLFVVIGKDDGYAIAVIDYGARAQCHLGNRPQRQSRDLVRAKSACADEEQFDDGT
jgi:hypothetical protein